ncbi:MAG: hypothetical protein MPJ50_00750, partial [Pirellulales bacterium]|nr:hypothetical protein [Pirellulales bacterium]
GGTYASQRIENLVHALLGLGVDGVGQTSWGPTVFAFCESESDAIELAATLRSWRSQDKFSAQELWIAKPRNTGFVTEG